MTLKINVVTLIFEMYTAMLTDDYLGLMCAVLFICLAHRFICDVIKRFVKFDFQCL